MYKYKKCFESMNTFDEGNNTIDFWEWYYRGKFKEHNDFMNNGKKDYYKALQEHYRDLLFRKDSSEMNLNNENYIRKHSAMGLLNQLKAIEAIFTEDEKEL